MTMTAPNGMGPKTPGPRQPAPTQASAPAQTPQSGTPGGSTLGELVKRIEAIEISDQHDFNEFCEAGRKLAHYLAVQVALAAGQIKEGAREMAKKNSKFGVMGIDVRRDLRAVDKRLSGASDHLGEAAADFVAAWHSMEKLLEVVQPATSAKKARGFSIDLD